ncbi:hypothetical protein PMIN01_09583 [Paraphaeosphaeria minitans]|uniref:RanBP2-type domain-containing protein n=1 Tax=Paraphaeosphaeria minitans TaxID=565426 RepID=A0A9P6GE92_9PLEO|nr:hypothetical protein PMIN01_09583 [Paraphaeosphaeria minitans]
MRPSSILPRALRRFITPSKASPSVTMLSIDSIGATNSTALNVGHFGTSTSSLDSVMEPAADLYEVALETPLQYGPPSKTVWYCGNCGDGPHNYSLNTGCVACGHTRDGCCTVTIISR